MNGDALTARELPGTAYCEALDVMLVAYGWDENEGEMVNDYAIYDFNTQSFTTFVLQDDIIPRYAPNVVSVEQPVASSGSCRFLLWGGSFTHIDNLQNPFNYVTSDESVWAIDLFDFEAGVSVNVNATEVEVSNPLLGRFGSTALAKNNSFIVVSGQQALEDDDLSSYPASDVYRFTLDLDAPSNTPRGTWTKVVDSSSNRFYYGATWIDDGERLLVHAGQGRYTDSAGNSRNLAQADLVGYKTNYLLEATSSDDLLASSLRQVTQGEVLYRLHHIMGAVDNTIFIFGGLRFVRSNSGTLLKSNTFVAITNVDFEDETISCKTSSGETVAWCGLSTGHPGSSDTVSGVQRGSWLVNLAQFTDDNGVFQNEVWVLNMAAVLNDGSYYLKNGYELEGWGTDSDTANPYFALQFSLIIVAIVAVCAVGVIHRSRWGRRRFSGGDFQSAPKVNYGVTKEVVDALPWIRFDRDGHYVRVRREVDEEGNETFVDIPGSEIQKKPSTRAVELTEIPSTPVPENSMSSALENAVERDTHSQQGDANRHQMSRTTSQTSEAESISSQHTHDRVPSLLSVASRLSEASKMSEGSRQSNMSGRGNRSGINTHSAAAQHFDLMGDEGELCAICLLEFEQDEPIKQLPCNHFFHADCIEPWLIKRGDCPLCKRHIITLRTIEEEEARRAEHGSPWPAAFTQTPMSETPEAQDVEAQNGQHPQDSTNINGNVHRSTVANVANFASTQMHRLWGMATGSPVTQPSRPQQQAQPTSSLGQSPTTRNRTRSSSGSQTNSSS